MRQRSSRRSARGAASPQVLTAVWSPQLRNRRDIHVYLPPSYDSGSRSFPVIYMHDGQNLADERTAFRSIWNLSETITQLGLLGIEAVIVGIPNMRQERFREYSPFRDPRLGAGRGEAYVTFIVETLNPLIDRKFRTLESRSSTGILGSSMGGLISLYAFFRYPEVFGLAGAMSPSLWLGQRGIFDYVAAAPFVRGRLYLDVGTAEGTTAVSDVQQMHGLLISKQYRADNGLLYVEDVEGHHDETAWGRRLPTALAFLIAGRVEPIRELPPSQPKPFQVVRAKSRPRHRRSVQRILPSAGHRRDD